MYTIQQSDLKLMLQRSLRYSIKMEVFKNDKTKMAEIYGITTEGSLTIDANSDIRRTCSFTLIPNRKEKWAISETGLIWLNNTVHVSLGLYNLRTGSYTYFKFGTFVFTNTSGTVDTTNNSISISCSDSMSLLDGTKNGQIGALTTIIPAYDEDPETGEPIKYNIIREAMIDILKQLCRIENYFIDDIGEYKAMPQNNPDWEEYRKQNEFWNTIPYDLEFSSGCSALSILQSLRDLHPNYEMFFDENNIFTCQMIPSNEDDNIILDNSFLQRVLISESSSLDMSTVRNICEVWGQVIDADFYTEQCKSANGVYICSVDGYDEKYYTGDTIAIKVDSENVNEQAININSLGNLVIYDENTEEPLSEGTLEAGIVYVFKVRTSRINNESITKIYYQGHWQAHALSVLVDGSIVNDIYTTSEGTELVLYSKEYFQVVYNCETVELNIIRDSPFAVQRIGEIPDIKTGGEYENITSDSLALARAHYENWKNSRLTDTITITTLLIPFLDVNVKVSYKPLSSQDEKEYIIKSVNHDFGSGTSSITMYRFYPLYENQNYEHGTHQILSYYTHEQLSQYTHEELSEFA